MRKEFVHELVIELVKNKLEEVSMDVIILFVEDILWYLENKEEEEYEINQYLVRVQELFRGYVVVVWEGTELSSKNIVFK